MERGRNLIIAGVGVAALAGVGVFLYQLYSGLESIKKEEEVEVIAEMQETPDHHHDNSSKHEEFGYVQDGVELTEISIEQLTHLRPLLPGHIDSAQLVLEGQHVHDVLVQYCHQNVNSAPSLQDCKQFAKPLGKVLFDDQSMAIVYRGDSSYSPLFGSSRRIDRLSVLSGVLLGCVQALQTLRQHHIALPSVDDLKVSVLVTPAGKIKMLPCGGQLKVVERAPLEQEVIQLVAELAESLVNMQPERWAVEREQVLRLCKDLKEIRTVSAAEKRLLGAVKHR